MSFSTAYNDEHVVYRQSPAPVASLEGNFKTVNQAFHIQSGDEPAFIESYTTFHIPVASPTPVPTSQPQIEEPMLGPSRLRDRSISVNKQALSAAIASPILQRPDSATSKRARISRARSLSHSDSIYNPQPLSPESPSQSTLTASRQPPPSPSHAPFSDRNSEITHLYQMCLEVANQAHSEEINPNFHLFLDALHTIMQRHARQTIYLGDNSNPNLSARDSDIFTQIIHAITPLLQKMSKNGATINHNAPGAQLFLALTGTRTDLRQFINLDDIAIGGLQAEVTNLKSRLQEAHTENQVAKWTQPTATHTKSHSWHPNRATIPT